MNHDSDPHNSTPKVPFPKKPDRNKPDPQASVHQKYDPTKPDPKNLNSQAPVPQIAYPPISDSQKPDLLDEELDLLPEFVEYRDKGCRLSPSCFNCPLPDCTGDSPTPWSRKAKKLNQRNRRIVNLFLHHHVSKADIAQVFGLSLRRVHDIINGKLLGCLGFLFLIFYLDLSWLQSLVD